MSDFIGWFTFWALLFVGLFAAPWWTLGALAIFFAVYMKNQWDLATEAMGHTADTPEGRRLKETYEIEKEHLDTHMNAPYWKSMPDPMARIMLSPDPAYREALHIPERLMQIVSPSPDDTRNTRSKPRRKAVRRGSGK